MEQDIPVPEALLSDFAAHVCAWQERQGRNDLPWQNTRDPYRVWLSEVMLQQTQVVTVLDYYQRFLHRFPTVAVLAEASEDEVLALWSGLGYYSRGRNLHRCAQQLARLHGGCFPTTALELETLPGIGPSTASAIAAFCFGERVAIFDGNVQRVLSRILAFSGDLSQSAQHKLLWRAARELLPKVELEKAMPRYTQGLMDLGATICASRIPLCDTCPVRHMCLGYTACNPERFPVKSRRLKRTVQHLALLWARRPDGAIWLERRPGAGIWGGLYCMPVFASREELESFLPRSARLACSAVAPFVHVLTHKDLYLAPIVAEFSQAQQMPARLAPGSVGETTGPGAWFAPSDWARLGLPTPIRKLLSAPHDSGIH